jgi:F-type H+-transporting ATPase subunit epsilon
MSEERTFRCELFSADKPVAELEATSVVMPARDGLMGVLASRAPVVTALGAGTLTVRAPGREASYRVAGGLARMKDNVLTVLAQTCQPAEQRTARWVQQPVTQTK